MLKNREQYKLPPITLLMIIVEIGIIVTCAVIFTRHLMDRSPALMFGQVNYPVAMLQYSFSAEVFQKTGNIAIWDPFVGFGEPMIENLASSVLNPLVTWPVLLFGPVQGGKVALFYHAILLGLGGWALGRMLRLQPPGRTMLGLLFLGSGSVISQWGQGFTHMAFPQVYIPWVFTGLISLLYMRRRWGIGLIAVSAILMVFAGGIWYVLPTAIGCAFISAFAIINYDRATREIGIDWRMVRDLAIATALVLGLGAIRWLTLNRALVYHPPNSEGPGVSYFAIMRAFFFPETPSPQYGDLWINYHYVIAAALAIFLIMVRAVVYRPKDVYRTGVWRILVPAIIIFFFLTLWAEGDTWFTRWLYSTIPPLADWKNSGRIGAGVTPWIAVMAAIWFDDILYVLWQARNGHYFQDRVTGFLAPLIRSKQKVRLSPLVATLAIVIVLGITSYELLSTLRNWTTQVSLARVDEFDRNEAKGLAFLRKKYPTQMLTVLTQGWIVHFGFMDTLSRSSHGDATIFTVGLPSTIGPDSSMRDTSEFAVGTNPDFVSWLKQHGYQPVADAPLAEGNAIAWVNPTIPPYAFWVERSKLVQRDWHPLTRGEVSEVTYYHQVNGVSAVLGDYAPDSVLVVNETAYPGWTIEVNGQPADLQSVGSRMAVRLPDKDPDSGPTYVTMQYKPPLLYLGGLITVLSCLISALFLLRVDRRIPPSWYATVAAYSQKANKVLTNPDLFKSEEDRQAPNPSEAPPDGNGYAPRPEPESSPPEHGMEIPTSNSPPAVKPGKSSRQRARN